MNKKAYNFDKDDARIFAFIAVFLSIIGFIISLVAKKNDDYVMYYAKQSLVVFMMMVVVKVCSYLILLIPIIGVIIYYASWTLIGLIWIVGSFYALSGEKKPLPIIGEYAESLRF